MPYYAQVDGNGVVRGIARLSSKVDHKNLIPLEREDTALIGQRWDGTTFAAVPTPTKPRLRVTADQTRIWELTPGMQPSPDQIATLTGQLLDAKDQPDHTAILPEMLLEIPRVIGPPNLILIRAIAGHLQVFTRSGWSPSIPFATEHSGKYDIIPILAPWFDVESAPVIEVLRG